LTLIYLFLAAQRHERVEERGAGKRAGFTPASRGIKIILLRFVHALSTPPEKGAALPLRAQDFARWVIT
jgi:hypothetical protein